MLILVLFCQCWLSQTQFTVIIFRGAQSSQVIVPLSLRSTELKGSAVISCTNIVHKTAKTRGQTTTDHLVPTKILFHPCCLKG